MGLVIGMDEAGYGPNLGPLVVTTTAWDVPGNPRSADFWRAFDRVLTQAPAADDRRLHVADSKEVYRPAGGLSRLERGVCCALGLMGPVPATYRGLWQLLTGNPPPALDEPWLEDRDLTLPRTVHSDDGLEADRSLLEEWQSCCRRERITLRAVRADIVLPGRFNQLVRECGSKGVALSRISLSLLARVWDPEHDAPALVIADKHGGRNRYDILLSEVCGERLVLRRSEGRERSVYRVGRTEVHFQTRAEAHFPVAVASMVSKYVRELSMELFNSFWKTHLPGLKPTCGYPTDARRFKADIAPAQAALGILDEHLWRER